MTFTEALLQCLGKYAVFTGRAQPAEFWRFAAIYAAAIVLTLVSLDAGSRSFSLMLGTVLVLTTPMLAVTTRRLHDIGLDGWTLVLLVPGFGVAVMLYRLSRPGAARPNRHGPDPAQRRERILLYSR